MNNQEYVFTNIRRYWALWVLALVICYAYDAVLSWPFCIASIFFVALLGNAYGVWWTMRERGVLKEVK